MFIPSTFKRPVSSWKALNLRKTLLMASSVRLKPLNCSRLPCVYAQDRKSGSAGMPRPISYAVFCLKKKSTEGGTIAGWTPSAGNVAQVKVDSSAAGAIYKGLAIATTETGSQLYATDFANARVDVFNDTWAPVTTDGGFVDRKIPDGYAPFGIQTIGDRIFVTYAKQGPSGDELHGKGLGFVDAYDTAGHLLVRVARHGALDAPWGLAMAPENFGRFGGDLLVGNFGDGRIHAYEERPNGHFVFRGTLRDSEERPIAIDGLWALEFGHGAVNNGPIDTLFFTAGPDGEPDGLFGLVRAVEAEESD